MSDSRSRNYSGKHPQGTQVPAPIMKAVASRLDKGNISCKAAHTIARDLRSAPQQIGISIDLQEGHIRACQLELLGCSKPKDVLQKSLQVPSELKNAIESALEDNRLPCRKAWDIADTHGLQRKSVAHACEALNIKVSRCQLGAF